MCQGLHGLEAQGGGGSPELAPGRSRRARRAGVPARDAGAVCGRCSRVGKEALPPWRRRRFAATAAAFLWRCLQAAMRCRRQGGVVVGAFVNARPRGSAASGAVAAVLIALGLAAGLLLFARLLP